MTTLFRDLRPESHNGVDVLWKEQNFTVLAREEQSGRIYLDHTISRTFDFVWSHDCHQIPVRDIEDDLCTIPSEFDILPGDVIIQKVFVSNTEDFLRSFESH